MIARQSSFDNYFRDYDPKLGRYVESDPIGLAGGTTTYAYAGGNPIANIDPYGLEWIYSQSSGRLTHIDATGESSALGVGYAGNGAGINNPAMQNIAGAGPLPQGLYAIAPQQNNTTGSGTTLPGSMRLVPDPGNEMYGRSGFLIHGDNSRGNQSASEGCMVFNRNIRDQIGSSEDNILRVVP